MSSYPLVGDDDGDGRNHDPVNCQLQSVPDGDCKPELEIVLKDTAENSGIRISECSPNPGGNLQDAHQWEHGNGSAPPPDSELVLHSGHYAKDLGLLSLKSQATHHENRVDVARMKMGYVRDLDHKAIEGDVSALSADATIGPAIVNAQVLELGYEAQMGRNTGGFVRANLANVGASVGRVDFTAGIGFDTGARAGEDGVEIQLLGCGAIVDKKEGIGVTVFGTSLKFKPCSSS